MSSVIRRKARCARSAPAGSVAALAIVVLTGCTGEAQSLFGTMSRVPSPDAGTSVVAEENSEPGFECGPAVASEPVDPGPALVRRMTHPEYVRTVRALLDVDVSTDVATLLPPDARADGFSNSASALVVTLGHVEGYEAVAELVASRANVAALAERLVACSDLSEACRTQLAERLGRHVFRAPPTAVETAALTAVAQAVQSEQGTFEEAFRWVLRTALQSPRFLYRLEDERGDGAARRVTDLELASRLSYFIQGAPPDAELLTAAELGALQTDEQIAAQARRLLEASDARETSRQYLNDWLNLGRLDNLVRDPAHFPHWDPALGRDMQEETRTFFDELMWNQNRPLVDLFNAQDSWMTGRLASHYGLTPADTGIAKYDLTNVPERGGLLTQGALLTIGGNEAGMVARGLFILNNILCGTIAAPPPGVDVTPGQTAPGSSQRTMAEGRLANPSCSGCHRQFEQLAFGLERFDGTGAHHLMDDHGNALREDGEVIFPGSPASHPFSTIAGFNELLAGTDRTRDCMTIKAAQFSFGRRMGASDSCNLRAVRDHLVANGGTYRELVVALAVSPAFRSIRTE